MRSNDAYRGFPHDVFCFTMLQEIVARSLHLEIGQYRHFAGSMHIYEEDISKAELYLSEGVQPRIEMPSMPNESPWPAIDTLRNAEAAIRRGDKVNASSLGLSPYWTDLVRLLQVFAARGNDDQIERLKNELNFKRYGVYALGQRGMASRTTGAKIG